MRSIAGIATDETLVDVESVRIRLRCVRDLAPFIDAGTQLVVGDAPEPPYWMHLWPAARVVARMIATTSAIGPRVAVVELGCGLALPSLTAAARGAVVLATDWRREALQFASASATANGLELHVAHMDWCAMAVQRRFDVCVGTDIAYDFAAASALVHALTVALKPGAAAWLADSVNTHRDDLYWALERAGFALQMVTTVEYDEGRPVWVRVIVARAPQE